MWRRVERRLRQHGMETALFVTGARGEATELTRTAIENGFDTIAAVGGDGTVHEVVNGFCREGRVRQDARLALVPAGTGMDFARNVLARRGTAAAARRLITGDERRVDIGLVQNQSRLFVNFAEMGLGAAVVQREADFGEAWPGRASFFLAAVRTAIDEDNIWVRIAVDGDPVYEGHVVSVVVANGRYFGSGMKIAPEARMDDGLLDILILGDFSRLELVSQIWKIYPGIHVGHHKVLWLRGRAVDIDAPDRSLVDLDGELNGNGPIDISILPGALRVLL